MITHYWGANALSSCGREVASAYYTNGHAYSSEWDEVDCPACLAKQSSGVMSDALRYRLAELAKITGSGGQAKLKIINREAETKWLNVTSDEVTAIETALTTKQVP